VSKTVYTIAIADSNQSFHLRAGETLLAGMEKSNCRAIRVGCRGGGCGLCKVKVLHGQYQTKPMSRQHIKAHEHAAGLALACRVLPESDLVLQPDYFQNT
jgi:ferredoxin